MPAKFQLNRHKIGELRAQKFGVQWEGIGTSGQNLWHNWARCGHSMFMHDSHKVVVGRFHSMFRQLDTTVTVPRIEQWAVHRSSLRGIIKEVND